MENFLFFFNDFVFFSCSVSPVARGKKAWQTSNSTSSCSIFTHFACWLAFVKRQIYLSSAEQADSLSLPRLNVLLTFFLYVVKMFQE